MEKTIFIYQLICPIDGKIKYIGATSEPEKRFWEHIKINNLTKKSVWIKSLLRANKIPILRIIDIVIYRERNQIEQFYIQKYIREGVVLFNRRVAKSEYCKGYKGRTINIEILICLQKRKRTGEKLKFYQSNYQ